MWYDDYVVTQLCQIWVMGGGFCHHIEVVGGLCDLMGYVTILLLRQSIVIRCGSIYSLRVRNLADAMTIFEYPDEATAPRRCNLPSPWGKKRRPTVVTAGRELKQTKRSLACFVSIANYIN